MLLTSVFYWRKKHSVIDSVAEAVGFLSQTRNDAEKNSNYHCSINAPAGFISRLSGLSIAQRLLEAYDATLVIENMPGGGVRLTVQIQKSR